MPRAFWIGSPPSFFWGAIVARRTSRHFDFRAGLGTSKPDQSRDALPFTAFYDATARGGVLRRRKGMVRLAQVTPNFGPYCGTFDAGGALTAVELTGDAGSAQIWDLDGLAEWTIETLCRADDLSSTRAIFARIAAAPDVRLYQDSTSGGRVVAELIDTGGATLTLAVTGVAAGTVAAVQLVKRSAASFVLRVNGTEASGTLASGALKATNDVLRIGNDNGGNRYHGKIDFVRLWAKARPDQRDGWVRSMNPSARYVLADYNVEADANAYCLDRSRFGRHASVTGSLGTSASLAVNPVPIQMLTMIHTPDRQRKLTLIAAGRLYSGTVR